MRAVHTLYAASASLDGDEEDMMWLTALLPSPAYIRAIVEHPAIAQGDETVHFVRCVGRDLWVYWVPDVTEEEAAVITAACEPIKRWSINAFVAAVGQALGGPVARVH